MRYARDARTKQDIDALRITWATRRRGYYCPVCGAPVHYRRSMGPSPDPGFAHNKYAAKPDCELYHPGFGAYTPAAAAAAAALLHRPPRAEDSAQEIGLCVADEASWALYLRLPDISEDTDVRLSSLRGGSVEVDAGGTKSSLSLMELRPGIGSARLLVAPIVVAYRVNPAGIWPQVILQKPWQGSARGLNPRGTPFRLRRGEWVRVKDGSPLELGEELRIIAEARNAPPPECLPEDAGGISHKGLNWKMWRIFLPTESSRMLEQWAEGLGVVLLEAAWDASIVSVPLAFDSDVPVFATKEPIVARLVSPEALGQTAVTLRTGSGSETTLELWSTEVNEFVVLSLPWPGQNELRVGYDERATVRFDTEAKPGLSAIRESLKAVPSLRVRIGSEVAHPWSKPFELPPPAPGEEPLQVSIEPDLEDLRLGLYWSGPEGRWAQEGLTARTVVGRLKQFWAKDLAVRISGGGLGSVWLRFLPARREEVRGANTRLLRWASVAATGDTRPASAWVLRQAARLDTSLLRVAQTRGNSRWMPLAVRTVRQSKL